MDQRDYVEQNCFSSSVWVSLTKESVFQVFQVWTKELFTYGGKIEVLPNIRPISNGRLKLNFDRCLLKVPGGVIRDHKDNTIQALSWTKGMTKDFEAEILELWELNRALFSLTGQNLNDERDFN